MYGLGDPTRYQLSRKENTDFTAYFPEKVFSYMIKKGEPEKSEVLKGFSCIKKDLKKLD